jgi:hypothetical protein
MLLHCCFVSNLQATTDENSGKLKPSPTAAAAAAAAAQPSSDADNRDIDAAVTTPTAPLHTPASAALAIAAGNRVPLTSIDTDQWVDQLVRINNGRQAIKVNMCVYS